MNRRDVDARLRAAIDKLETLRGEAFPGTWEILTSGIERGDHWYVQSNHEAILSVSANDGSDEDFRKPTAALIVTLHRTIDAQLQLLAYGVTLAGRVPEEITDLADAILGGAS